MPSGVLWGETMLAQWDEWLKANTSVALGCVFIVLAFSGCASDPSTIACTSPPQAVEVSLQPHSSSFLVPVEVNGHTLQMVLDTGGITSLTETSVQRWHIPQSGQFSVGIGYNGSGMH